MTTKKTETIKLYNTATRRKEDFVPLDADDVRMYVCGPTVYDRAHLGNARPVIVFDTLYRLLRHTYGEDHVTYVRNFTDVDDKINARAAESGRSIGEITAETTQWYLDDMAAVGALQPSIKGGDHERAMPRATQWIAPMIAMIEDLIAKGHAYEAEGHALFAVESYKNYGALSGRSVDDMIAGARVEVAPYKRNPMDFVLWKPSTDDQPGWDSPWGRGRPGWHIECSAMAYELLGAQFDIHGGGNDLQFPHHENEIAQSKCAGHGFARYWLHNEMLQVEGKKMSKSLGNFFTVRDLLDQGVPGEVIRFVMLGTHYRKPMDWTDAKRAEAEKTLRRWRKLVRGANSSTVSDDILNALRNDLNTSQALSRLAAMASELDVNQTKEVSKFLASAQVLGLLTDELAGWDEFVTVAGYMKVTEYAEENNISFAEVPKAEMARLANVSVACIDMQFDKIIEDFDSLKKSMSDVGKWIGNSMKPFREQFAALGKFMAEHEQELATALPDEAVSSARKAKSHNVVALIQERTTAKAAKDWALADSIRDQLKDCGFEIVDTPNGPKWRAIA